MGNACRWQSRPGAAVSALIYCPFPDIASAKAATATLLDKKLIACANILGETLSIFEWQGERGESSEIAVLFKTHESLLNESVGCLSEIHPYDAPAIMGWRCDVVPETTRSWLEEQVQGE
ncbi:Protein CutA like protein [Altererythrobacter insulae]|nr:Protein CutA like protein [Altererythrobacter insulae]